MNTVWPLNTRVQIIMRVNYEIGVLQETISGIYILPPLRFPSFSLQSKRVETTFLPNSAP